MHNFLERSQENRPLADKLKDGTSKRIRPKKKTRQIKGNKMTALRFLTTAARIESKEEMGFCGKSPKI